MSFMDIGIGELLLILGISLIILGPNRVVEVGRTLGKWTRALKKATFDLTTAVTKEVDSENKKPSS